MLQSPLPCWCNESYVRNSSLHCVKIEDCLKDEEQKSEILTSSALKSAPNPLVLHTPLETVSQVKKFIERIDQDIPHLVFGKTENPSAENQPLEIDSRVQKFNGALDQKILDLVFGKPANFPAENNNREYGSRIPEPLEGTDEEPSIDLR